MRPDGLSSRVLSQLMTAGVYGILPYSVRRRFLMLRMRRGYKPPPYAKRQLDWARNLIVSAAVLLLILALIFWLQGR